MAIMSKRAQKGYASAVKATADPLYPTGQKGFAATTQALLTTPRRSVFQTGGTQVYYPAGNGTTINNPPMAPIDPMNPATGGIGNPPTQTTTVVSTPLVGGSGPTDPFDPNVVNVGGNPCAGLPWWQQALCSQATGYLTGGCTVLAEILGLCTRNGTDPGSGPLQPQECPSDRTYVPGVGCVAPGDAFPGGDPMITTAGGQAVAGAFGMPAMTPVTYARPYRDCPGGMVLGKDNLCYPKQVLPRRSKFRKWRPSPRPAISAADAKTLRRAKALRNKIKDVASDAGFSTKRR